MQCFCILIRRHHGTWLQNLGSIVNGGAKKTVGQKSTNYNDKSLIAVKIWSKFGFSRINDSEILL